MYWYEYIMPIMPCSKKHNLHLKNTLSSNSKSKEKYFQAQEAKYDKLSLQVQYPGKSNLQRPIFKLFFVDAINWKLYIYFC